jgi:tetrahydromethanopterin S-methyltransferase subunit G
MHEVAARQDLPTPRELLRMDAAVAAGLRRARQAGCKEPSLRDAVWELLLEAGDTLNRLPDRERGWLTAASRAHWPDVARCVAAEAPLRLAPAEGEAIDRLDTVLAWLPQAAGTKPKRDLTVLFGLACGLPVALLRRKLGCGRRTIYDVRDRGIARVCLWLRQHSAYCRSLA